MKKRNSLRRRAPFRKARPRLLVVCEGAVTEAEYFRDLTGRVRTPLVEVVIDAGRGVPATLVDLAIAWKRNSNALAQSRRDVNEKFDQVWCVFDIDEHPKISEARQKARSNGIRLAESNPCFELWALLHYQDQTAYIDRATLRKRLQRHLPGYDKLLQFDVLHATYTEALRRAVSLRTRVSNGLCASGNPSTGVDLLTEMILSLGRLENSGR